MMRNWAHEKYEFSDFHKNISLAEKRFNLQLTNTKT
jgi:hypothetical protein